MKTVKESKIVYKTINITEEEQLFCKQILELVPNVIADEAVSKYYESHEDELLKNFLEDIANTGCLDLRDYE